MIVAMETERLETLEQVRGFVEGSGEVNFELTEVVPLSWTVGRQQ